MRAAVWTRALAWAALFLHVARPSSAGSVFTFTELKSCVDDQFDEESCTLASDIVFDDCISVERNVSIIGNNYTVGTRSTLLLKPVPRHIPTRARTACPQPPDHVPATYPDPQIGYDDSSNAFTCLFDHVYGAFKLNDVNVNGANDQGTPDYAWILSHTDASWLAVSAAPVLFDLTLIFICSTARLPPPASRLPPPVPHLPRFAPFTAHPNPRRGPLI